MMMSVQGKETQGRHAVYVRGDNTGDVSVGADVVANDDVGAGQRNKRTTRRRGKKSMAGNFTARSGVEAENGIGARDGGHSTSRSGQPTTPSIKCGVAVQSS